MPLSTKPFWAALVDDAAIFPPGDAEFGPAVAAHVARDEPLVGSFVLRDTDVPALREHAGDADLAVSVVLTGGAGQVAGPAAYCSRTGLRLAGLEVALRDLDDLAGNARRVVAAVDAARADGSLDEEVPVYVELPGPPSYGWLAAADEVAGAELRLKYRTNEVDSPTLAAWIDAALDREAPFKCTAGLHRALRHDEGHGFLNVLLATVRAFDGASADEVVATLEDREPALDPDELARGRRWFTSFGSCSIDEPLADLRALGLHP
ncbi:MAG TPA: hypothetical protein VMF51_12325 [Nocardioides sp.]|uniref:hypothetical protein n=1 Tax=Nocardioides sp. TaxID=35761 RepID=UPI002D05CC13|nr:hypothetical protein [Nocardioides sp.]HTW15913.1 hypothetical protein [Nocardioides sp.]